MTSIEKLIVDKKEYVDCDFRKCNFDMTKLNEVTFINCDFRGVYFDDVKFYKVKFEKCDLNIAAFYKGFIDFGEFINCDMPFITFKKIHVYNQQIINCNLANADFSKSTIQSTRFKECALNDTNWINAKSECNEFSICGFTDASLSQGKFDQCRFRYGKADSLAARFTVFTSCEFTHFKLLEGDFYNAKIINTKLPDNILHLVGYPFDIFVFSKECIQVGCLKYPLKYWVTYFEYLIDEHDVDYPDLYEKYLTLVKSWLEN